MTLQQTGQTPTGLQPLSNNGFMVGIKQTDLVLPTFRLVQGSSEIAKAGSALPGTFYSPEMGISKSEVNAVVYMIRRTQTLWSEEMGNAPRCSSDDGFMPRPGSEFEGTSCEECVLRLDEPYTVPAEIRRQKCLPGYSMMCMDLDTEMPFLFRAAGTSVPRVKTWITAIHGQYQDEPFRVRTIFRSEQKQGQQGSYFVAVPHLQAPPDCLLPEDDVNNNYRPMAQHMTTQNIVAQETAPDSQNTPSPTTPNPFNTAAQAPVTDDDDSLF